MQQDNQQPRVFKIGTSTIVEDDSLVGLDIEGVKQLLVHSYPEIAHATLRERTLADGTLLYEWVAVAGRKG